MSAIWEPDEVCAADWASVGNEQLSAYFTSRTAALEHPLAKLPPAQLWSDGLPELRRQLRDMLGLDPLPERTPLQATVTRTLERDGFRVENLHFQSLPGLYVTANLYLPPRVEAKIPAILYVCGHATVKINGVSYGNKTAYHHHGVWFARNGYACLIIDTLQLGEIEGIHHGTYRYGRWWWQARGYTPAGVETWNGMRALDYLASRPEVDPERLGVTGRSGGGAYSGYLAALDERIKAAVPVAGITSLRNHVVDGCVEGHCDCMYPVNTYRWDFEQVAALAAPRALLLSNTDKDAIFPVEGVFQVFLGTRRVYNLLDAGAKLGLNLEEGPHKDTQPLQTAAFHWMNRHLRGTALTGTFSLAATSVLEPADLKVFQILPADERNTRIDESFVPAAPPPQVPASLTQWRTLTRGWRAQLQEKCFRGWPVPAPAVTLRPGQSVEREGLSLRSYEIDTEPGVTCSLHLIHATGGGAGHGKNVIFHVLDEAGWREFLSGIPSQLPSAFPGISLPAPDAARLHADQQLLQDRHGILACFCPRGIGGSGTWSEDEKKQVQIRRRFALLGQTVDGMRTWDVIQAIRGLGKIDLGAFPLTIRSARAMGGNALYAALYADVAVQRIELDALPSSHLAGPFYLNVLRVLDAPQAVAMAAEQSQIVLATKDSAPWKWAAETAAALGWATDQFRIVDRLP